jgi:hypothetical protein
VIAARSVRVGSRRMAPAAAGASVPNAIKPASQTTRRRCDSTEGAFAREVCASRLVQGTFLNTGVGHIPLYRAIQVQLTRGRCINDGVRGRIHSVIARAALVLSVVAVGLSIWALARPAGSTEGTCGVVHKAKAGTVVTCTGKDAPSSRYGTCTPLGRQNDVMYWSCKPKEH